MLAGMTVSWVQANMSHRLPADQFVVGLVLNVLVLGVVGLPRRRDRAANNIVGRTKIPGLAEIPLLGPALFDQPWVLYLAYPLVPLIWYLVYRTRWGLEVRAVGEDPNAADVSGLHVNKVRRQTIYLAGITAGLSGSMLLFARSGSFEDSLVGGRGYIAIAAVIFGGWTLKGTVGGCVLFGIVGSFVLTIPGARLRVDRHLVPRDGSQRRDDRGHGDLRDPRAPALGAGPPLPEGAEVIANSV